MSECEIIKGWVEASIAYAASKRYKGMIGYLTSDA